MISPVPLTTYNDPPLDLVKKKVTLNAGKRFNEFLFLVNNGICWVLVTKIGQLKIKHESYSYLTSNAPSILNKSFSVSFLEDDSYVVGKEYIALNNQQMRLRQVDNWRLKIRKMAAATLIQKNYKRMRARRNFIKKIHQRYNSEMTPKAIVIQKYWKMLQDARANKLKAFCLNIKDALDKDAIKISKAIKGTLNLNNLQVNS